MDQTNLAGNWESVLSSMSEESDRNLFKGIFRLHERLREHMRDKYQRSVSLADELTDRWERARYLGFGVGASIYDSALVIGDVHVGEKTWIGPQCVLDGSGGLTIGRYCSVATGCQIYSHDTVEWALSGGRAPYRKRPTQIGNACYLGPHSIISAGTTLGDHSLVGALSLIKGDIPAHSIVVGIPARVVGQVCIELDGSVRLVYGGEDRNRGQE